MGLPARAPYVGATLLCLLVFVGLAAPWLAPADPFAISGPALAPPGSGHPFGTDDLGRDVYAGVVHGAWTSLLVGLAAAAGATALGLVVGGAAGISAGAVDHVLMRGTEFAQALPRFFFVVMTVSLFGGSIWLIVATIALTAWPATARVFRALVQSTVTQEYVVAARASGGGPAAIARRHVLPATLPVVGAQVAYQVGGAILAEAGLSFLGLGDPTRVSWGTLLGAAHQTISEAWWIATFPGVALTLTVLACNLVADGLVRRRAGVGRIRRSAGPQASRSR